MFGKLDHEGCFFVLLDSDRLEAEILSQAVREPNHLNLQPQAKRLELRSLEAIGSHGPRGILLSHRQFGELQ